VKGIKMIPNPPCSLDITLIKKFFLPKVKSKLADLSLSQDSFKKSSLVVMQTIAIDEFATAFQ
jgi:hypothetical protein